MLSTFLGRVLFMTRAAHNGHDWLGDSGIVEVPDEFKQLRRMLQKIADGVKYASTPH